MEEAVTFWLDNKISSGFKVAEIGTQMLVSYRDKYYVVEGGAAKMKGVRPLHFSKSSLPTVWKKAIKGILPPAVTVIEHPEDKNLPVTTSIKKERPKMIKSVPTETEPSETRVQVAKQPAQADSAAAEAKPVKTAKKPEAKALPQSVVVANCPYCNHKHELTLDKGKSGKPFFVACARCTVEFAVRFVPVTIYQAQVAAFR
ncbi:MAG: hypothetical protein H7Y05_10740 [Steroidobacteraceae bacterium]|nr:hypothetical protein [Deltaproteobacteria bacterium]